MGCCDNTCFSMSSDTQDGQGLVCRKSICIIRTCLLTYRSFHMGEIQCNQLSTKWLAGLLEAGIISEA